MIIYAYNIQYNMIFYNLVVHDNLGHDLGVYKARSRFEHRWLRYLDGRSGLVAAACPMLVVMVALMVVIVIIVIQCYTIIRSC